MFSSSSSNCNNFGDNPNYGIQCSTPKPSSLRHIKEEGLLSTTAEQLPEADNEILQGVNKTLFNGEFFQIIKKRSETEYEKKSIGIIAACKICPNNAKIKGSLKVTSNFLHHLRKKHPPYYQDFLKLKANKVERLRNNESGFVEKVLEFVAHTYSPLSVVESEQFRNLFSGSYITNRLRIPDVKSLTELLNLKHHEFISSLKQKLSLVSHLCMTADMWSGEKISFFGYTCHWIDNSTLKRESAALACRRIPGTYSFDKLSELIQSINYEYGIHPTKIIYLVTGNGSNFIRAFEDFGITKDVFPSVDERKTETDTEEGEGEDDDQNMLTFRPLTRLSKHVKSASHTLTLVASTDFLNELKLPENSAIYKKHKDVINRCTKLWKKCNRPKSAEKIKNILSIHLITPCVGRWSSLYDCIQQILQYKNKLVELSQALDLPKFQTSDIEYLKAFVALMSPIAAALDFLQSEENMYFGYFIPTVITVIMKLHRLRIQQLKYLGNLPEKMKSKLQQRFASAFHTREELLDAIIATVVCPNVKLRFLSGLNELVAPNNYTDVRIKQILLSYAREFATEDNSIEIKGSLTPAPHFFDFGDSEYGQQPRTAHCDVVAREINNFLNDPDDSLECLRQYPVIQRIFLKYNTPIPSSAPVERLFSFEDVVSNSMRQHFPYENFEKFIIMNANKSL